jgi:DNA-binding response OmpR family regulator
MRVLLVEHPRHRGGSLRYGLQRYGIEVVGMATDTDPRRVAAFGPDAIVLESGLLDRNTTAACERLRARNVTVPIVAVVSRADARTWLRGRQAGVDDFLVRPFGLDELVARLSLAVGMVRTGPVSALPRRQFAVGTLSFDDDARCVRLADRPVSLTPKEYSLLRLLARNHGEVVRRDEIASAVWHTDWVGAGRTLEVHVASLRAKLGVPGLIATVRGTGYRLAATGGLAMAG